MAVCWQPLIVGEITADRALCHGSQVMMAISA